MYTPLLKIKHSSEKDSLAIAYAFYNLYKDIVDLESHHDAQKLYFALVDRLNLQKHSEKICAAFIEKLKKNKKLTPVDNRERFLSPFEYNGKLLENFNQDSNIYQHCGSWKNSTVREVNLLRVVFADPKMNYFSKLIAMTFFMSPEAFVKDGYKTISSVSIPANVKKVFNDLESVKGIYDVLNLNFDESLVLQMGYRSVAFSEFYNVCNTMYRVEEMGRFELLSKLTNKPIKEIRQTLKISQKLVSYGFFTDEGEIEDAAIDAIYEHNINSYFVDIIKDEKNKKVYGLDSFSVKQEKTDLAVQFLKSKNPCNILLYGAPGAGKTEYAKSLINAAGLKMTTYKNEIEVKGKDGDASLKGLSRLNCYLSLKKEDSILVVDEAESVLKTIGCLFGMKYSLPQKGTVNKMLEESENKVIWILNYTDELDESTLRRFTYSIRFNEMPKETLRSIAEKKFSSIKMPKTLKTEIVDMCGKYHVTGASVENIVKAVKSIDCTGQSTQKVISDVKNVLEANSSLVFGKKKIRDSVKDSYNLDILNTSIPAGEVVEMIENAIINKEESFGTPDGIRMLFYGLSGTGKTELARYISEKTGKKLLLKRASDIMGKYVGDNEQNIKEAFEEAEETDSILLFDEADSFFANRENANTSWERTMVNEFLTQMEEFSGILICTTNLRKIMDPAMQRRFHILTEFKPLTETGIKTLLESYFKGFIFTEEMLASLIKQDSVTPGDFGTLRSKIRFMAKDKITPEFIIQELKNIQKEKQSTCGARIGFAS